MFQIPSHVIDDPPYVFAYEMIFFWATKHSQHPHPTVHKTQINNYSNLVGGGNSKCSHVSTLDTSPWICHHGSVTMDTSPWIRHHGYVTLDKGKAQWHKQAESLGLALWWIGAVPYPGTHKKEVPSQSLFKNKENVKGSCMCTTLKSSFLTSNLENSRQFLGGCPQTS